MGVAQSYSVGSSKGFKPAPASMAPIIHLPTVNLDGIRGGLMSPAGTMRMQPTARPPPPPRALAGLILIHAY